MGGVRVRGDRGGWSWAWGWSVGLSGAIYVLLTVVFFFPRYLSSPRPLDLMKITGYDWRGALLYLGAVGGLFWIYAWAWRACRREGWSLGRVLVPAGMFGVILLGLYPINATDLLQYVARARVWVVHGANPLAYAPGDFPQDPLMELATGWKDLPSPYGPAWELIAAVPMALAGGRLQASVWGMKGVAWGAYMADAVLIASILRRKRPDRVVEGTLLFAWNPVVLLELVGNGHNDGMLLFWVLLAVWAWARGRRALALPLLAVGGMTKAVALLGVPVVLALLWRPREGRWWRLCGALGGTVVLGLLLYLPFWPPWEGIAGVLDEATERLGFSPVALIVSGIYEGVFKPAGNWPVWVVDGRVVRWLATGGMLCLYVLLLWRLVRGRVGVFEAIYDMLLVVIFLSSSFRMWYPVWLVPWAALAGDDRRRIQMGVFGLCAEWSVGIYGYLWKWMKWSAFQIHLVGVPWTFFPSLLVWVLGAWRKWYAAGGAAREGRAVAG